MYRHLDALLEKAKGKIKAEFARLGAMGFDELNVTGTRKVTAQMFDRLVDTNKSLYLKAAREAYKKSVNSAKSEGFEGKESNVNGAWVIDVLAGFNLVTGYLYQKEVERKRLRLNEQILTAREYGDGGMFNDSLRRTANLWWTQSLQYGVDIVDKANIKALHDMGVSFVRWVAADDEKTCSVCGERDDKIYKVSEIPPKTHYGCRCYVVPVKKE